MSSNLRNRLWLFAVLPPLCETYALAATRPPSVVWVSVDYMGRANEPLEEFTFALFKHKKARLFRMCWGTGLTSYRGAATVLYDRKKQSLRYYWAEFSRQEDESQPTVWTQSHGSDLYTGVTDRILFKLAAKHKNADSSDLQAFIDELPNYGCHMKNLWHKTRPYPLK